MARFAGAAMRSLLQSFAVVAIAILLYLAAAVAGALVPARPASGLAQQPAGNDRIILVNSLLHADIAVPVTPALLARFAYLAEGGLPLAHPGLRYLVFGWGSRDFYTSTAHLSDIGLATTFRAVTGDSSVMHVYPSADLHKLENILELALPDGGLEQLLGFLEKGFENHSGERRLIAGVNYGMGDAFYESARPFDIMRPCNNWVAEGLRQAGVPTGIWTPVTGALKWSLRFHAGDRIIGE
ncbi:MAG: TIGR02117 family protein [Rhizobiaceae bacterium]